ncbi:MAG: energy-coupling factor ABC transporter ATP-binding protein [Desulfotalea sp.]
MPVLEISHLTFTYPTATKPSLKDLSFTVASGELVAVIGANNSGKSSLCYALTGVIPHFYGGVFAGSVLVDGIDTADWTISDFSQIIGLVMQVPTNQLSGIRYTVFEEVAFGLENLGVSRSEIVKKVTKVLSLTGLSDLHDRSPYELSGGQQQKLALAAILVLSPSVLVLDEPTTFLDPQGSLEVFDIISDLKRQGKTVIIAEQSLEWIAEYADRVIVLANGELVLNGTPEEVLTNPKMKLVGLDWTPYTKTAELAKQQGLWGKDKALPSTFAATVAGFSNS